MIENVLPVHKTRAATTANPPTTAPFPAAKEPAPLAAAVVVEAEAADAETDADEATAETDEATEEESKEVGDEDAEDVDDEGSEVSEITLESEEGSDAMTMGSFVKVDNDGTKAQEVRCMPVLIYCFKSLFHTKDISYPKKKPVLTLY